MLCLLIGLLTLTAPSVLALSGKIREFPIPPETGENDGSGPLIITAGPDGNLWFTENNGNRIGRISPGGEHTVTQFLIPTSNSFPTGITAGPDGNLWFTDDGFINGVNHIGQLR